MPHDRRSINVENVSMTAFVEAILYGCLCSNFAAYASRSRKDTWPLRLFLVVLWVLNTIHIVLTGWKLHHFTDDKPVGSNDSYTERLFIAIGTGCTCITTFLVRGFYIIRLQKISGSRLFILVPSTANLAFLGIVLTGMVAFSHVQTLGDIHTVIKLYIAGLSLSVIGDISITSALLFYLRKRRATSFIQKSISRRVIVAILNVGLLATLLTSSVMILLLVTRNVLAAALVEPLLGYVFTITLILMLNYRPRSPQASLVDSSASNIFTTHIDVRFPLNHLPLLPINKIANPILPSSGPSPLAVPPPTLHKWDVSTV